MRLNELFQPPPDETSGETMLRAPMPATLVGTNQQKQLILPKGTVVHLVKKLPQKRLVVVNVDGKQYASTEQDWQMAVGLK